MSNYGRNVEFRIAPHRGQKNGRYVNNSGAAIVLGAPIAGQGTFDGLNQEEVDLVTGATVPVAGRHGICIVEHNAATGWAGRLLTTFSDIDTAPDGDQVIMVSGEGVKVLLRNTEDRTFLNTRSYDGRTMVAGLGATPTVAVGDYLTPGTGDDDNGYWAETANANEAWMVVTHVDTARGEIEARLLF